MTNSLADWSVILKHFTNYAQDGHNFKGFPVRCFVRYRVSDKEDWHSFWDRERNTGETWYERDNTRHAEQFVIERLRPVIKTAAEKIAKKPHLFKIYEPQDCSYSCYPHTVHLYYGYETETRQYPQEEKEEVQVKCSFPTNFVYGTCNTFTCYNPASVTIEGKVLDETPVMVNCESLMLDCRKDYWNVRRWDKKNENKKNDTGWGISPECRSGKIEVEFYLNTSPCPDYFRELQPFVEENTRVFLHVKYASFFWESNLQEFENINANGNSRLKITEFTGTDWRILVSYTLELADEQIAEEVKEMEDFLSKAKNIVKGELSGIDDAVAPDNKPNDTIGGGTQQDPEKNNTVAPDNKPNNTNAGDKQQDPEKNNTVALDKKPNNTNAGDKQQDPEKNNTVAPENKPNNTIDGNKQQDNNTGCNPTTDEAKSVVIPQEVQDLILSTIEVTRKLSEKINAEMKQYFKKVRELLGIEPYFDDMEHGFDDWRSLNRELFSFTAKQKEWMCNFVLNIDSLMKEHGLNVPKSPFNNPTNAVSNISTKQSFDQIKNQINRSFNYMNIALDSQSKGLSKNVQELNAKRDELANKLGQLKIADEAEKKKLHTAMIDSKRSIKLERAPFQIRAEVKILNEQARTRLIITKECAEANIEISQIKMKHEVIMSLKKNSIEFG